LFFYLAIAYLDNIFSAIGFVFHTFSISTTTIPMSQTLWGAIYVVCLLVPFTVSVSAIVALPKIWQKDNWKKDQKLLASVILTVAILLIMLIASDLIQTIGKLEILKSFI
jgi:NADH:ubiquinone oxidoreductase subunit 6 (subunit J)